MKKLILLGIVATLFTFGASAQSGKEDFKKDGKKPDRHHMVDKSHHRFDRSTHSLTRGERAKMGHNAGTYQRAKHKAFRDGKVGKREQRNLAKMKKDNRKDAFRYKHNRRHGVK